MFIFIKSTNSMQAMVSFGQNVRKLNICFHKEITKKLINPLYATAITQWKPERTQLSYIFIFYFTPKADDDVYVFKHEKH